MWIFIYVYIYTHNRYIMFCSKSKLSIVIFSRTFHIQTSQLDFSGFAIPCPVPSCHLQGRNLAANFMRFLPNRRRFSSQERYSSLSSPNRGGNNIIQPSTFENPILTFFLQSEFLIVLNTQNPANPSKPSPPAISQSHLWCPTLCAPSRRPPRDFAETGPETLGFLWANRNVGHPEMANPDESHALFQLLRFALNPQPFPLLT